MHFWEWIILWFCCLTILDHFLKIFLFCFNTYQAYKAKRRPAATLQKLQPA